MQAGGSIFTALVVFIFCQGSMAAPATDSLRLTLPEAEKIFLERNFDLIAAQYNIDISKAYVQQARYWDNPVLNTDQNIYDGKFFRHDSNYGQVYLQIQQVIKTAGKRNKLIKLSQDAVLSSSQQFNELLRNLRYLLQTDFFSLHELLETSAVYNLEADALQNLARGMDAQWQAGNISLKENLRIKSLLYSLQADQADVLTRLADIQKEIHVLLQLNADTLLVPVIPAEPGFPETKISLQQMLDSAKLNRPDLGLAATNLLSQKHNLSYQKALAVPDLAVAVEYDQRSTYVNNYVGLGISLPIPILNTNKGNIRAAGLAVSQAEIQAHALQHQSDQEVMAAYEKFLIAARIKKQEPPDLIQNYDRLLQNMIHSYEQKKVSLLEFIDFFDAYKDSKTRQLRQLTNLYNAAAEINFTVGVRFLAIQ